MSNRLEEIIGKTVTKPGADAPSLETCKARDIGNYSADYARLRSIGCANSYLNKKGDVDYKKDKNGKVVGAPNISEEDAKTAAVISQRYNIFENMKRNYRISKVPPKGRSESNSSKQTDELSVVTGDVDPIAGMIGKIKYSLAKLGLMDKNYISYETLTPEGRIVRTSKNNGLVSLVSNAYNSLTKTKKLNNKQKSKMKKDLSKGNIKSFVQFCNDYSTQLRKKMGDKSAETALNSYYFEGVADASRRQYDTIIEEAKERGLGRTGGEARVTANLITRLNSMEAFKGLAEDKYLMKLIGNDIVKALKEERVNGVLAEEHTVAQRVAGESS